MTEMNRQQICAALGVSESTIRRLEQLGLPYTPVGVRSHRYDLGECKTWLKANPPGATAAVPRAPAWAPSSELSNFPRKRPLRVMPSE